MAWLLVAIGLGAAEFWRRRRRWQSFFHIETLALKAGDKIVRIDGIPTEHWLEEDKAALLRKQERGRVVLITVLRAKGTTERYELLRRSNLFGGQAYVNARGMYVPT